MQFNAARGNNHPYSPILPLLADTNAGRVAVPNMTLPSSASNGLRIFPDICAKHGICIKTGLGSRHVVVASEQSVSPEILPYIAKDSSGFAQMKQCWVGRSRTFSTAMGLAMSWSQSFCTDRIAWNASWDLQLCFETTDYQI